MKTIRLLILSLLAIPMFAADAPKPVAQASVASKSADEDITGAALAADAPKATPPSPQKKGAEDADITPLKAAPSQADGGLLPSDPTAAPLPAAKPYDAGNTTPLVWKDTPLDVGIEQVAKFYGVKIDVTNAKGSAAKLNGDYRGIAARDILKQVAIENHFVLDEANGAFSLSPSKYAIPPSAPTIPVIASRTITVPVAVAPAFLKYYAAKKSADGTMSFISQGKDAVTYRINDTPYRVQEFDSKAQALEDEYNIQLVAANPKFKKERERLLAQRSKLAADYMIDR